MKDPVWRGLIAALRQEAKAMLADGKKAKAKAHIRKYLADDGQDLNPSSFEQQVQKAGGRCVAVAKVQFHPSADWHELDI